MQIEPLRIPDILLLKPSKHQDQRGFFSETFRADILAAQGVKASFVQDNHVRSTQKGVLRGLHYQIPPHAQGKLVRCSRGSILDVARRYSGGLADLWASTWRWSCRRRTGARLWVPPGFAHGYVTLEDDCEVIYKVTDYYAPDCDRGIAWDDPALAIDWRISRVLTSSYRTRTGSSPALKDVPPAFQFTS